MRQIALLLLNGEPPSQNLLNHFWEQTTHKICADGAANLLHERGLQPDIIIGDFDSISEETQQYYSDSVMHHISEQDTTDCEKALQYCSKKKINEVILLGALGKRMDHSLYNLGILRSLMNDHIQITLHSDLEKLFLIHDQYTFSEPPGTQVSFLPIFGSVKGVQTKNFQYPIHEDSLELGFSSSISNRIIKSPALIKVEKGSLLVVVQK